MKQDLYTIQEVATLLGVSAKTLRRWEETGKIKPIRTVGNQRRYRLDDIKKLERRLNLQKARQEVRKEIAQEKAQHVPVFTPLSEPTASSASPVGFMPLQREETVTPSQPTVAPAPQVIIPESVQAPLAVSIPEVRQAEKEITKRNSYFRNAFRPILGATAVLVILLLAAVLWQQTGYPGLHSDVKGLADTQAGESNQSVLAASNAKPSFQLEINLPSFFGKKVSFLDSVSIKKG